jgi:hypothetical protein
MDAKAAIHAYFGRLRAQPGLGEKGVDGRFRGHDGFDGDGGKRINVFCGAPPARGPFSQKSDRLLLATV